MEDLQLFMEKRKVGDGSVAVQGVRLEYSFFKYSGTSTELEGVMRPVDKEELVTLVMR